MGVALTVKTQSLRWLTGFFVLLVLILLTFLACGEYTRKARVTGFLSPNHGMLKIYTPQAGTVTEKKVKEGQKVQPGDVLFVLSSEQASPESPDAQTAAIANIVARRDSLLQELEQQDEQQRLQWQEMQSRINALSLELQQIEREIDVQQRRTQVASNTLEKFRTLYAQQYVAEVHWQEKQDEALARQAELQALQRDRLMLKRELQSQNTKLQSIRYEFARQRAELDRTISRHDQEITEHQAKRSIVIRAPRAGVVTAILLEKGQQAGTQSPLLSLLPEDSTLEAHLLVPSRSIGFLSAGQTVALRYQAFPYQRFGSQRGQVKDISRTLIKPGEADFPVALDEPAYRVVVQPEEQTVRAYEQAFPLQAGMLLDADIQLDRRTLFEWVFDPLYSLAGTL